MRRPVPDKGVKEKGMVFEAIGRRRCVRPLLLRAPSRRGDRGSASPTSLTRPNSLQPTPRPKAPADNCPSSRMHVDGLGAEGPDRTPPARRNSSSGILGTAIGPTGVASVPGDDATKETNRRGNRLRHPGRRSGPL